MRTIFTKHLQNREKVLIKCLPLDGKLKTKHAANGLSGHHYGMGYPQT